MPIPEHPEAAHEEISIMETSKRLRDQLKSEVFDAQIDEWVKEADETFESFDAKLQDSSVKEELAQAFLDALLKWDKERPPNPKAVMDHFDFFKDKPYAENVCLRVVEIDPHLILEARHEIEVYPWGRNVLEYAEELDYGEKIRPLNDAHDQPREVRFKPLEGVPQAEMYNMIAYTFRVDEEPLYTSTFFGIYDHMLTGEQSAYSLLVENKFSRFSVFLSACAAFGKLDDFMGHLSDAEKEECLDQLLDNLESSLDPLEEGVILANLLPEFQKFGLLSHFETRLASHHAKTGRKEVKQVLGITGAFLTQKFEIRTPWTEAMSEQFQALDLKGVDLSKMPDKIVEIQFFYDDADGDYTYKNFVNFYRAKGWIQKDEGSYVTFTKVLQGKTSVIYATKPSQSDQASMDVIAAVADEKVVAFVHRGHSYHLTSSLDMLRASGQKPELIYLGSCGGSTSVRQTLDLDPNAHIISTQGRGARAVNEPLLGMLNSAISTRTPIVWDELWKEAEQSLGKDPLFKDYIPPSDNIGVELLKVYNSNPL